MQKIKHNLVHKAKVRKQYAKIRKQHFGEATNSLPVTSQAKDQDHTVLGPESSGLDSPEELPYNPISHGTLSPKLSKRSLDPDVIPAKPSDGSLLPNNHSPEAEGRNLSTHSLSEARSRDQENHDENSIHPSRRQRIRRRPKSNPYKKEMDFAENQRFEKASRLEAVEKQKMQRQRKTEERVRFRNAMAKARQPGPNGQRKLGRESKVLLEKVKSIANNDE